MSHIAIVGAGIGGLAAAVKLAALGHHVEIFEGSSFVGGKCRTETIGGYSFDLGPSLFTLPAVYRDLFLKTGKPLEEELELLALDPAFEYRFADGATFVYRGSRGALTESITDAFGATAAHQWQRLLDRGGEMWRVSREPFIQSPIAPLLSMMRRKGVLRDTRIIAPHRTLRSLGRSIVSEPHLRMLIDRYATYTGSDPRKAPSALLTIPYIETTFGAWHIKGGVGSLSLALARRAETLGVTMHLSTEVRTIETSSNAVSGVRLTNGDFYPAEIVISNADATHTFNALLDAPRQAAKLAKAPPSLSGFVLLLGLRGRTPGLGHNTVLFPTDYDAEFDALFGSSPRLIDDPTIYICSPDDAAMRPHADSESWFVLVNTPGTTFVDWSNHETVERYKDHVIDLIEQRGMTVRDRIEVCEVRTPADFERENRAPGGGIYGKAGNSRTAALSRTQNGTHIRGLYSVGGSVHPGGGLPMVGIGAEIVCKAIGPADSEARTTSS